MVKPSTIYYNSAEMMKDIPSKVRVATSTLKKTGNPSTSEGRCTHSAPLTPAPSVKFKSPKHLGSTVSTYDAVLGDFVDTARVAALKDSFRVSN